MYKSMVTQKGQITIPMILRKNLKIQEGDKVVFRQEGSGIFIDIIPKKELKDLCGFLPKPARSLSIDEMSEIIQSKQ